MHQYFIKIPWLVKRLFSSYTWSVPTKEPVVYLTFDDGPHPQITPWVLDELKKHGAKATFFCIGKNVVQHPEVYQRIQNEGHAIGNHTHNHLNGWKVATAPYVENAAEAAQHIASQLFRPPYGRIKKAQAKGIQKVLGAATKIIMWDVLSADFDTNLAPEQCLQHVLRHTERGSIIVFHDSEKAARNMQFALPKVLQVLGERGYRFQKLDEKVV